MLFLFAIFALHSGSFTQFREDFTTDFTDFTDETSGALAIPYP